MQVGQTFSESKENLFIYFYLSLSPSLPYKMIVIMKHFIIVELALNLTQWAAVCSRNQELHIRWTIFVQHIFAHMLVDNRNIHKWNKKLLAFPYVWVKKLHGFPVDGINNSMDFHRNRRIIAFLVTLSTKCARFCAGPRCPTVGAALGF